MRLKIKECLAVYNEVNDTKLSMKGLAVKAYKTVDNDTSTQINRLSSLNTGRKMASVKDVGLICDALDCDCDDLIEY